MLEFREVVVYIKLWHHPANYEKDKRQTWPLLILKVNGTLKSPGAGESILNNNVRIRSTIWGISDFANNTLCGLFLEPRGMKMTEPGKVRDYRGSPVSRIGVSSLNNNSEQPACDQHGRGRTQGFVLDAGRRGRHQIRVSAS
ncbi:hypothetical protein TEQG_04683 [Trichophyton equinum CBS 127.97]|uniref:Uncharacterized protein n=1 Tax=Trichophyton equinum (strain ATCC MYA-4606 / CBS 127.97) TaxID=559882 RepID=F2PUV7_TRIEC|nr:hypothetical protein TEQG_04683 [Trichophyton equinum CBS 127.97]